jgi:hypothetical protein
LRHGAVCKERTSTVETKMSAAKAGHVLTACITGDDPLEQHEVSSGVFCLGGYGINIGRDLHHRLCNGAICSSVATYMNAVGGEKAEKWGRFLP